MQCEVCIVGNGAVGKTLALGLAQLGLSVTLLGASSQAQKASTAPKGWDLRVYALNHVARSVLSSIKVWDALVAERVAAVETMQISGDAANHAGGELTFDAYGARVDALAWIVEDANLTQALDAALRFATNVRLVDGQAAELRNDAAGATVALDDGSAIEASLVIGADGAQSWVRAQCDIGIDYRPYHQRAVVANFACERPHYGVAYQWFAAAEGIIALLPLSGNQVSLVWSAPDALAERLLAESVAQLAQRLAKYCDASIGQLTPLQPEAMKAFPLSLLRTHAITAPRAALVGDAAHVVHPLAGHGMNLGFADVAALLKILAAREPHRDCGDARVLARYARMRKEDILLMQFATDGLQRLFGSDFEPLRTIRNFGLNLFNRLHVVKRQLISQALGR